MRRLTTIGLGLAVVLLGAAEARAEDTDIDGDGLSDFHEVHKYFTDPARADSDGDGTPDGAWDERREYAYSIRTVVRVMRPVGTDLDDDYQDARVLEATPTWVKLEVVTYPLNTVAAGLVGDPAWREAAKRFPVETAPGLTSNFDRSMTVALSEKLRAEGIDVDTLDDKALVTRAAQWLLRHAGERSGAFTGYFTHFPDGKPAVHPDCARGMAAYDRGGRPPEAQWARDLFAKGMFEGGVTGSCTSYAIYQTGALRALGIPTRIVYCIPAIDVNDPQEQALLAGVRHPEVRRVLQSELAGKGGWLGHTFNEVFVGGRWRRLNYRSLADNVFGSTFGLMIRVLTVDDWSEAGVAATIGARQSAERYDDVFGHANPYSTVELSDRFGIHMRDTPAAAPPPDAWQTLTIQRALWVLGEARPGAGAPPVRDPQAGHVLLKVGENHPEGGLAQYAPFWQQVAKTFVLRAAGHADVPAEAVRGYWASGWFVLEIADEALATMAPGVRYALVPTAADEKMRWQVADGVGLQRPAAGIAPDKAPDTAPRRTPRRLEGPVWSDDEAFSWLEGSLGILVEVAGYDGDFEALKAYQGAGDGTLWLEADGTHPVRLHMGTGGVTMNGRAWILLRVPGGAAALESGVAYGLRPEDPAHWQVTGRLPPR